MKRTLISALLILIPFVATGCADGGWNDYNTPTKFLSKAESSSYRFYLSINIEEPTHSSDKDYNLEVRNALADAKPFKKSERSSSDSQRYFDYIARYSDAYIGLAPALYCTMSVYDDGFIKIDFQEIKEHKYAYFEMDAIKAKEINDLVYTKIPKERAIKEEDREQAYQDGEINNFITSMEKKSSIKVQCDMSANRTFYDNGDLLNLIKDVEYTPTYDSYPLGSNKTFIYNVYEKGSEYWTYELYDSGDYVRIYYSYKNRLEENETIHINYQIDASQGEAIIAKAIELGNK